MGLVLLLKTLFHMKATDAVCGFTFLRKEAAEQLVRESSQDNGWFYTIEFLLRAERDGMKIYDMPVEWQEDDQELSDSDVSSEKGISSGRQTQKIND